MASHGILLLGHGTPSKDGTRAFLEFVDLVKQMSGETPVEAGFMEFASPTIFDGAQTLKSRGVARITAVPMFLSGAGHTANDIPVCVSEARKQLGDIPIHLAPHVGSHAKTLELSALRYREAIADRPEFPAEKTILVVVAHGSPESESFEELKTFAAARSAILPGVRVVPCFSQMGRPLLKEVLPELIAELSALSLPSPSLLKGEEIGLESLQKEKWRVVVQPHFLLKGRLVDAIASTVAGCMKENSEIDWIVAEPLGGHPLLAEAALELGMDRANS
jgi:sirohydrochlorin cobaltochelatase